MNIKSLILLAALLPLFSLQADGRRYVWTYEYQTLHRGEAELESYTEFSHLNTDSGRQATTTLQYEYEIGMNNWFDVGIYQKFKQAHESPIAYDGFKLRMRFKLGEKGRWPLDPLIYLEYKDNAAFDHSALETKLILARDFEKLNVSLNPVLEFEFDEDETGVEFEYTAGLSYRVHPILSLGLETKGNADQFYWGPTLSHGKNDLWFGIGLLIPGPETASTDRLIRFIIGVGL
ncbi:MAG: hypothetical protein HOD43_07635 [Candidatus Marinimicrobia bacterium]|jgi:hypothetical protein|nr:hypothetical protein [Candidatus Neomarinimicrobiota bacterium]MBT3632157.1 hypothetical protein [Candidatus Neomarinimicrobiota bacterium]MBT3824287.1 hypothetical protein [Candidatus Neomarinimicrobiota bacterium]MBT4129108.1 hypothetical protein [Candidatus Neomarinimicrobiota bacterium]MBT4295661.1 hypothetical protein [Candidatus Neomarinimicrobiota bacterium]